MGIAIQSPHVAQGLITIFKVIHVLLFQLLQPVQTLQIHQFQTTQILTSRLCVFMDI